MLGFPRSGTTWAGNLLNAHPRVTYRHEAIGRTLPAVADSAAFESLKSGRDFSEAQYSHIMRHLLRAYAETDRPPFFPKKHWVSSVPRVRWFLWLAARKSRHAERLYEQALSRSSERSDVLLLKETRSSQNLLSILEGVRAVRILWLIRNPAAVVASHLKGFEAGTMAAPTRQDREDWYAYHADRPSIRGGLISSDDIKFMQPARFVALQWRIWNEDMLEISQRLPVLLVDYERLFRHTDIVVAEMLDSLGLRFEPQVAKFITASTESERAPLIGRDSGSAYYSVYRGDSFDPNHGAKNLSESDRVMIREVLAGSPLLHLAGEPDNGDRQSNISIRNHRSPAPNREYWVGAC